MQGNVDITLYRKRYDPELRDEVWKRAQYVGTHWQGDTGLSALNKRNQISDSYTVRIFTQETLDVQAGDIVVRGVQQADTPADSTVQSAEHFSVTSVRDNRRGSPLLQHWKLGGG